MKNKAFIFDMDGVMIDDESPWHEFEQNYLYPKIFGQKVAKALGKTVGMNMQAIYDKAVSLGAHADREAFLKGFFDQAPYIYGTAPIPEGLNELGKFLAEKKIIMALVSQSPLEWIDIVLNRLTFGKNIDLIISLHDRKDLAPKPAPDGYNETIQKLGFLPEEVIILEDSNKGIASAKASGAFVIGFSGHLLEGYKQEGADIYAKTMDHVIKIVESIL